MAGDEAMEKAYLPAFQDDLYQLEALSQVLDGGDWDVAVSALSHFQFVKLGQLRKYENTAFKDQVQNGRKMVKESIASLLSHQFCASEAEYQEDIAFLRPISGCCLT